MYDTLSELLEARFAKKPIQDPVVFILDEDLAEVDELQVPGPDGEMIYNPTFVSSKADQLGYWCEPDWDAQGGGFVFAPANRR